MKKTYEIPVARMVAPGGFEMLVVLLPWEEFDHPLVRTAHRRAYDKPDMPAVLLSKSPDGAYHYDTQIEKNWKKLREATEIEQFRWHMMKVECDFYPRELL